MTPDLQRILPFLVLLSCLTTTSPFAQEQEVVYRGPDHLVLRPVATDPPARLIVRPARESFLQYEPVYLILTLEITGDDVRTSWPRFMNDNRVVFFSRPGDDRTRYWWANDTTGHHFTQGVRYRPYPRGTQLRQFLTLGSTGGHGVYDGCPTGYIFKNPGEYSVWVRHGAGGLIESETATIRVVEPPEGGEDAVVAQWLASKGDDMGDVIGGRMGAPGGDGRETYDMIQAHPASRYTPYLGLFLAKRIISSRRRRLPPYNDDYPDDAHRALLRDILEQNRDDPALEAVVAEAEFCQAMLITDFAERRAALERLLEREDHLMRFFIERERNALVGEAGD